MSKAVLIAEDNDDDAMAIRTALRNAGVTLPLKFVTNGSSVIDYFKGTGEYVDRERFPLPNVLLLDLKMPRLDGFQVMEWLATQKRFHDLLIVVLSGNGELSNMRGAFLLGARSFLTKPCRVADVKNLMRAYSTYWEPELASDTPETSTPLQPGHSLSDAKNSRLYV